MQQNTSSVGSIVGTIIILALIIIGALYFWGKHIQETENAQSVASGATTQQPVASPSEADTIKSSVSSSDDLSSLQTDLNNTNTTNLTTEANQ